MKLSEEELGIVQRALETYALRLIEKNSSYRECWTCGHDVNSPHCQGHQVGIPPDDGCFDFVIEGLDSEEELLATSDLLRRIGNSELPPGS